MLILMIDKARLEELLSTLEYEALDQGTRDAVIASAPAYARLLTDPTADEET